MHINMSRKTSMGMEIVASDSFDPLFLTYKSEMDQQYRRSQQHQRQISHSFAYCDATNIHSDATPFHSLFLHSLQDSYTHFLSSHCFSSRWRQDLQTFLTLMFPSYKNPTVYQSLLNSDAIESALHAFPSFSALQNALSAHVTQRLQYSSSSIAKQVFPTPTPSAKHTHTLPFPIRKPRHSKSQDQTSLQSDGYPWKSYDILKKSFKKRSFWRHNRWESMRFVLFPNQIQLFKSGNLFEIAPEDINRSSNGLHFFRRKSSSASHSLEIASTHKRFKTYLYRQLIAMECVPLAREDAPKKCRFAIQFVFAKESEIGQEPSELGISSVGSRRHSLPYAESIHVSSPKTAQDRNHAKSVKTLWISCTDDAAMLENLMSKVAILAFWERLEALMSVFTRMQDVVSVMEHGNLEKSLVSLCSVLEKWAFVAKNALSAPTAPRGTMDVTALASQLFGKDERAPFKFELTIVQAIGIVLAFLHRKELRHFRSGREIVGPKLMEILIHLKEKRALVSLLEWEYAREVLFFDNAEPFETLLNVLSEELTVRLARIQFHNAMKSSSHREWTVLSFLIWLGDVQGIEKLFSLEPTLKRSLRLEEFEILKNARYQHTHLFISSQIIDRQEDLATLLLDSASEELYIGSGMTSLMEIAIQTQLWRFCSRLLQLSELHNVSFPTEHVLEWTIQQLPLETEGKDDTFHVECRNRAMRFFQDLVLRVASMPWKRQHNLILLGLVHLQQEAIIFLLENRCACGDMETARAYAILAPEHSQIRRRETLSQSASYEDPSQLSLLHVAIQLNLTRAAEKLIDNGAPLTTLNAKGYSTLVATALNGMEDLSYHILCVFRTQNTNISDAIVSKLLAVPEIHEPVITELIRRERWEFVSILFDFLLFTAPKLLSFARNSRNMLHILLLQLHHVLQSMECHMYKAQLILRMLQEILQRLPRAQVLDAMLMEKSGISVSKTSIALETKASNRMNLYHVLTDASVILEGSIETHEMTVLQLACVLPSQDKSYGHSFIRAVIFETIATFFGALELFKKQIDMSSICQQLLSMSLVFADTHDAVNYLLLFAKEELTEASRVALITSAPGNALTSTKTTLLHLSMLHTRHLHQLEALLILHRALELAGEKNGSVSSWDGNGWTPLHLAVLNHCDERVIQLFSRFQLDLNPWSEATAIPRIAMMLTPLIVSALVGNAKAFHALVSHGVSVTQVIPGAQASILHVLARHAPKELSGGMVEIIEFLLFEPAFQVFHAIDREGMSVLEAKQQLTLRIGQNRQRTMSLSVVRHRKSSSAHSMERTSNFMQRESLYKRIEQEENALLAHIAVQAEMEAKTWLEKRIGQKKVVIEARALLLEEKDVKDEETESEEDDMFYESPMETRLDTLKKSVTEAFIARHVKEILESARLEIEREKEAVYHEIGLLPTYFMAESPTQSDAKAQFPSVRHRRYESCDL